MTLLKWVLIVIYAVVDALIIYNSTDSENESDFERKFNLYLDNINDDTLHLRKLK